MAKRKGPILVQLKPGIPGSERSQTGEVIKRAGTPKGTLWIAWPDRDSLHPIKDLLRFTGRMGTAAALRTSKTRHARQFAPFRAKAKRAANCACAVPNKSKPKRRATAKRAPKRANAPRKRIHAVVQLTHREWARWQQPAARLRILAAVRKVAKQHGGHARLQDPNGNQLAVVGG